MSRAECEVVDLARERDRREGHARLILMAEVRDAVRDMTTPQLERVMAVVARELGWVGDQGKAT